MTSWINHCSWCLTFDLLYAAIISILTKNKLENWIFKILYNLFPKSFSYKSQRKETFHWNYPQSPIPIRNPWTLPLWLSFLSFKKTREIGLPNRAEKCLKTVLDWVLFSSWAALSMLIRGHFLDESAEFDDAPPQGN